MRQRRKERPAPRVYTITDTAFLLNGGRDKVYALIDQGELDTVQIGRRRMVTAESVDRLLQAP